jgi:hypothetical protein
MKYNSYRGESGREFKGKKVQKEGVNKKSEKVRQSQKKQIKTNQNNKNEQDLFNCCPTL